MEATNVMQAAMAANQTALSRWEGIIDKRPSDRICALMSKHVYEGKNLKTGDTLPEDPDWEIVATKSGTAGYFGAVYYNDNDKHYVVAHRGTANAAGWFEDFRGIWLGHVSPQKEEAYYLTQEAVTLAKKTKNSRISFTGHSLGAFLAELSTFYCYRSLDFLRVNAVTFESPGSRDSLDTLQSQILDEKIDLNQLDIVGYVSYSNLINTCNHRVGTSYQLDPALGGLGWVSGWYTAQAHSMDGLVKTFESKDRPPRAKHLADWPVGNQKDVYFKQATFGDQKYQVLPQTLTAESFKLEYSAHYKIDEALSKPHVMATRHLNTDLQEFLLIFYRWKEDMQQVQGEVGLKKNLEVVTNERIKEHLLNYTIGLRNVAQINNTMVVRLKVETADITQFRQELSEWLSKAVNRKIMTDLINKPAPSKESPLKALAMVVAKGAKVGSLKNVQALGIQVNVPPDGKPQDILNANAILKQLQTDGGDFRATIVEEGGIVTGTIENAVAAAIQINVGHSSSSSSSSGLQSGGGAPMLTALQMANEKGKTTTLSGQGNSNAIGSTPGGK